MSGRITIYEKETGSITGIKQWLTEAEKTSIINGVPTETHDYKEEAAPSLEHKWNGTEWELTPTIQYALLSIRTRRRILLQNCDWTQLPDCQLSDAEKAEWATYRQALRDLPANYTDTDEASKVVWPDGPDGYKQPK
jgi:hypothetical protein